MNKISSIRRICCSQLRSISTISQKKNTFLLGPKVQKYLRTTSCFDLNYSERIVYTKKFFFSTMPIDESRAQARDDHLKEEVLNEKPNSNNNNNNNSLDVVDTSDVPKRRRLSEVPISEVLKSKHTLRWVEPTVDSNSTVREAISVCIDRKLSAMMVIESSITGSPGSIQRGKVVGLVTARDLLRVMDIGFRNDDSDEDIFNRRVGDFMTPITKVIYARPEETIGMCRSIMAKLGVKCLPILSSGRVEGLITSRDMAEFGLDAADKGGKKHYLENKSERVGLSTNTSMAEPPAYIKAHLALQQTPLFMNVASAELPHPYKTAESCGINRRGKMFTSICQCSD